MKHYQKILDTIRDLNRECALQRIDLVGIQIKNSDPMFIQAALDDRGGAILVDSDGKLIPETFLFDGIEIRGTR